MEGIGIPGLRTARELLRENESAQRRIESDYGLDLSGWGAGDDHRIFDSLVRLVGLHDRPGLAIEVGSWKGRSASRIASLIRWNSRLVCVDTWLGATEMVGAPAGSKRDLMPRLGYPQIYYQFMANMSFMSVDDRVIPFPQSSTNAARYMLKSGVKADLIYIDASHEFEDVYADLQGYARLLKPGGVMFGDDYCEHWRGVMQAVDQFVKEENDHPTATMYLPFDPTLQTFRYENAPGEAPSDYWVLSDGGIVV